MKARIFFYCAAVVALVLFLAATASRATERRDPVLNPEQTQAAPGHSKVPGKPTHSQHAKKTAHPSAKPQAQAKADPKKTPDSSQEPQEAGNRP